MSCCPSKGTTTTGAAAAAHCTSSGTAKHDEEDDTVLISNSSSSISDDDAGGDQDHQEQPLHHESSANLFIHVKSTDLQQKLEARKRQNSTTNTTTMTRRPGYLLPSSAHSMSSSSHQREQRRSSVWDSLGKLDDDDDLEDSTGSFHSRVLLSPSSSSFHHSRTTTTTTGRDGPGTTRSSASTTTTTSTINHMGDSALPPRKTTKTPRRGGIVVHSGSLSLSLGGSLSAHTPNPLATKTTKQKQPRPTSSSGYSSDSYASDIDTRPPTRNSFQDSNRTVSRSTSLTVNVLPITHHTRNNSVPPQERYRRRGSVTQYSLDGCNTAKQPAATPSNHYQPDYDSDLDPKQSRYSIDKPTSAGSSTPPVTVEDMGYEEHIPTKARNRSVPRRGSVTKYSLDQSVTLKDHFESDKQSSSASSNSSCCSLDRGGGYGHATSTTKSINGDRSLGGRPPLSSSAAFTTETVPAKKTRAVRRGSVTKYSLEPPTAVDYESHDEDEDSSSVVSLPTMSTNRPLGQRLDRRACLYSSATAAPHLAKAIAVIASGTADEAEIDRAAHYPPKPGDDNYSTNLEDSGRLGRRSVSLTDFDDNDDSDEDVAAHANGKQPAHPSVLPLRRWSNDTKPPMHHALHKDATQVGSPGPAFARLLKKQPIEEDSGHIKKSCFQAHDDVGDDDDDSELRDSDDEFSGEASKIGSRFGNHGRGSTDSKLGKFLERNNMSHIPASPTSLNGPHAAHHSSVRRVQGSSSSRRPSAGGSDTASVVSTTSSIDSTSRFRQRRGSMVMASTVETPVTINTPDTPVKKKKIQTPVKHKTPETPVKHRTSETQVKHKTPETPAKLAISVERKPLCTKTQSPRKLIGCLKTDENQSERGWATMSFDKQVRFGQLVIFEFPIILGDNPAVTSGAPVTIDWEIQNKTELSVNAYEQFKPKRRRRRKLLISVSQRAILLLAAGYSIDEIADASMLAQNVKDSRKQSLESQSWDRVHFLREATGDAVAGLVQMPAMALQQTGKKLRETLMLVKPQQHSEGARMA